jgi:hypothetical protein
VIASAGVVVYVAARNTRKSGANRGLVVREHVLKIRLSAAELARLEELAEAWGIATKAGMLRALLRGAGPPERPVSAVDSLDMLLRELPEFDGLGNRTI